MARSINEDKGKVKFKIIEGRTIEFELEGSNSNIEESIKNIVFSLGRTQSATGQRTLTAPNHARPALVAPSEPTVEALGEPGLEDENITAEETLAESSNGSHKQKGPRVYSKPKFLSDLDLEAGDVSFREFVNGKEISTDNQKYLVIAAWFKKHHNLETISTAHFYTVYDSLSWKSQRDFTQPLRYLKIKNCFEVPSKSQWKITPKGMKSALEGPTSD